MAETLPLPTPTTFPFSTPRLQAPSPTLSLLPRRRIPLPALSRRRSVVVSAVKPTFGSRMEASVRKTVEENAVVIYSKTWCSYSVEVKALLKRLGVEPLVIELDELGTQGLQLRRVLERITGQFTVPNVFIGGKHIGGCSDTMKLHRKGELATLLSQLMLEE